MQFKEMTIYQIYPRSFYDSNGDGIGDLAGITAKLEYLKELGVDMVWITPFYISPQNDNGYDVADYYAIDPLFGTMADFEAMVAKGKSLGIEFMLDMVLNHSSTEHKWFQEALAGDKEKQEFYIFKDGATLPTNWISKFGGSAWHYVSELDKHYLHLFDVTQADWNWEHEAVRKELANVVNFWLEKGVHGFRFDVINLISKGSYEDDHMGDGRRFYTDGPKVHHYLQELNKNSFGKKAGMVTVGEMSSTTIEHCVGYSNPNSQELSMVFSFHHLKVDYKNGDKWSLMDFDFIELKKIIFDWQLGMQKGNGWSALFWSNHDQPRVLSRFGNDSPAYRGLSAKMLATAMHFLRGTPYIYQGEEIGLPNAGFKQIEQYRDVESLNYYNILMESGKSKEETLEILRAKSRDNARTPMPWTTHEKHAGFTSGEPWIGLIEQANEINVEKELADTNSIFHFHKKIISLRKQYKIISEGSSIAHALADKQIFVYERQLDKQRLLVVCNFYEAGASLDLESIGAKELIAGELLLSNYENKVVVAGHQLQLRPYEGMVLFLEC